MQGTHGTGKTGKMAKKIPCQGKHKEFNFLNTGIYFSSSCKCSDFKVKDIAIIAAKKSIFF